MAKVVVGLSGGVDSSVAAYLLKEQGHEVVGLFMKNWHNDEVTISKECPWIEDSNDALLVAQKLQIPFQTIDLSEGYKSRIVDYMFKEYQEGRTPNPDVLCNREIKFDLFLKAAVQLGAEYVATGHYCRKTTFTENGETIHQLLAGKDPNKDQSYFLCQLTQEQLSKAMFPVGALQKSEVRQIATKLDLATADKKDSQGLCFVGKVRLPEFLQQKLMPKKGEVIEVPENASIFITQPHDETNRLQVMAQPYVYDKAMGKVVGNHQGAHYYTIGQRKGLAIGGMPEPLYVIGTDTVNNIIYTGQSNTHPGLLRKALFIPNSDIHWIRTDLQLKEGEKQTLEVRIRYRQQLSPATLFQEKEGLYIIFEQDQWGIAPGQFAAWYKNDELLGSGVIE